MQFTLNSYMRYNSVILKLAMFTALGAFACTLFGYLFLPFAAASYATLIAYENQKRRIFTYATPAVMFVINLLLAGPYSLEGVAYVLVGIVIYFLAKLGKTKGEVAFWSILLLLVLMFLSAILFAMDYIGSFSVFGAFDYYAKLLNDGKTYFVDFLLTLKEEGKASFAFTEAEAILMFNELVIGIIPTSTILAFILTGATLKIFTRNIFKYGKEEPGLFSWSFNTSNTVAYFYVIIFILSLVVPVDAGAFYHLVTILYSVFSLVYTYIGVKFLYALFLSKGKRPILAILIIAAIFVVFSSFVIGAISLLGVYVNNSMNKLSRLTNDGKKH